MTLFGKVRRAILSVLLGHADEAFYLRQIVRTTGFGLGPVQRELKLLTDSGIIRRTVRGRQVYFQANPECLIFHEIKNVVAWMAKNRALSEPSPQVSLPKKQHFNIPGPTLAEFCRRNHIARLSLFGSVLGNNFRPDSDIDVLVEFEPN
ncbi:MAG: nucleotidyltransferase domain-containing protein, partial [Candidatus Aminicenantales bacterium]